MVTQEGQASSLGLGAASWGLRGWAHLAGRAGLPPVPATVAATVAHEGRVAAEQDVEDDAQAPEVTALVVDAGLLAEGLHHLGGHVLGRAARGKQLWCGDGGAVPVELDTTAQVEVADLHGGHLAGAWREQ